MYAKVYYILLVITYKNDKEKNDGKGEGRDVDNTPPPSHHF